MKTILPFLSLVLFASTALAATAVQVNFTLRTTDANGAPITQSRSYHVYRPDNLPLTTPRPMLLSFGALFTLGVANPYFDAKATAMGFVVVTGNFLGNSLGNVWNNDNPRITGWEDFDYTDAVIAAVKASDNCSDRLRHWRLQARAHGVCLRVRAAGDDQGGGAGG